MSQHYRLLADTKQQYRELFQQAATAVNRRLLALRTQYHCPDCTPDSSDTLSDWLTSRHDACGYRAWQAAALRMLETEIGGEILAQLQAIDAYKNTFDCHMCGMCCRMASSEHSYDTLLQRAKAGDDFAKDFTSVFLPYESREAARQQAPDVVDAVLAEAGEESGSDERIFFYHCPYVQEDNRCGLFNSPKRPSICSSYPETPLSFVYERCAWKPWKDETHPQTLQAHALLAYCDNLCTTLRKSLSH